MRAPVPFLHPLVDRGRNPALPAPAAVAPAAAAPAPADRIRHELPDLEHVLVVDEGFGRSVAEASDRCETLDTPADQPAW